jgi:hypothetical protein
MPHFYFIIIILMLCFGCASPPKYHGQFSGMLQPAILQDIAGEKFSGVKLKIDSAKFSSSTPHKTIVGRSEILVNSSRNCCQPIDFKTNQITIVRWMQTGAIKSPLSHKEIWALQNDQYFYGALVVKRRNIYYSCGDQ